MTNTAGTQDAPTRRPTTAEIVAGDELLTALRSIRALGSRVESTLALALERFVMDMFGSQLDGEEVMDWIDEDDESSLAEAVARIFDGE